MVQLLCPASDTVQYCIVPHRHTVHILLMHRCAASFCSSTKLHGQLSSPVVFSHKLTGSSNCHQITVSSAAAAAAAAVNAGLSYAGTGYFDGDSLYSHKGTYYVLSPFPIITLTSTCP